MARPRKETADWFPHYAQVFTRERDIIDYLCSEYGHDRGYAWYYRMKEHLCLQPNYRIENFTKIKKSQLAKKFGIPDRIFCAMVATSVEIGGHVEKKGVFFSPWLSNALAPLAEKRKKSRRKKNQRVSESETQVSSSYKDINIDSNNKTNSNNERVEDEKKSKKKKWQEEAEKGVSESVIRVSDSETQKQYERIAKRIFEGICATNEVFRRKWSLPDGTISSDAQKKWIKWVPQIRLLVEKDKAPVAAVWFILEWIFGGTVILPDGTARELEPWEGDRGFCWYDNIQSGKKLREKFPRLCADAKKSFAQKKQQGKQAFSSPIYEF